MIDRDSLRLMIRDVIETEVERLRGEAGAPAPARSGHAVRIESNRDLNAFARAVLSLADNASVREQILANTYPFQLENGDTADGGKLPAHGPGRMESGVVTEATLAKLPKGLKVLELGPGVVVTPLARERARALGITFERRRV